MTFPATERQIEILKEIAASSTIDVETTRKARAIVAAKSMAGRDVNVGSLEREWRRQAAALRNAEQQGKSQLKEKLLSLLTGRDDDGCCGCDDEENEEQELLSDTDMRLLARKVYDLMRYEVLVERERLGLYRLS